MNAQIIDVGADLEVSALTDRLRRNKTADQLLRGAYNTLASILKVLPMSDDLLMSPEALGAWQILRDGDPSIYLTYRAAVRQKCGRHITDLLDHHIGPPITGPSRKLVLLTPTQMCNLPVLADALDEWIPSQGVVSVIGGPGCGKSVFIDHIVNCLGAGIAPIAGRRFRKCTSLVIAAEGNRRTRVQAWCQHHRIDSDALPVRYVQQGVDLRSPQGDIDQILELIDITESDLGALGFVVVDTLNRTFGGGSENDAADMGCFLANLQRIAERTKGVVIVLHHVGKDASKGARGHGSLLGAVDGEIVIARDGDMRMATVTKLRDGAEGAEFSFLLDVVDLGPHPDPDAASNGKRLTSIVIAPQDQQQGASKTRQAKVPAGARVVLDALRSAMSRHGVHVPGMAVADRNIVVDVEHWRTAYETMRPISADDADARKVKQSRRMAFNRAQDQLQSARIVGTDNGKWWIL